MRAGRWHTCRWSCSCGPPTAASCCRAPSEVRRPFGSGWKRAVLCIYHPSVKRQHTAHSAVGQQTFTALMQVVTEARRLGGCCRIPRSSC